MKKWLAGIAVMGFLLGGCSAAPSEEAEPKMLEVELPVNPEKADAGETVSFEAAIRYGDETVTDADEVKFEIWKSQDEHHDIIPVKAAKNGKYALEKSFTEEGTYYVYSHVTARDMHIMPKKEFIIGKPSEPEEEGSSSMNGMEEHEEEHSHK